MPILNFKEQGSILITIVMILSVLTVLVLANLRWLSLDWRRYEGLRRYEDRKAELEAVAENLGKRFSHHPQLLCSRSDVEDTEIKSVILTKGCKAYQHYRFLAHDLGVLPCVKLSPEFSTHHWLLSILDEQLPLQVLQMRVVSAEAAQFCPATRVVFIQAPIVTRRWL